MISRINETLDSKYPLNQLNIGSGHISYRESGRLNKDVLVLLHGIGSASGSWFRQLEELSLNFRVIAWDAPGYGKSTALSNEYPKAIDYAQVLEKFFKNLNIQPYIIVGHSLGALIAGSYAASYPNSSLRLILVDPANGHGELGKQERSEKLRLRLDNMDKFGPEELANERAPALLSKNASVEALELVRWNMSKLRLEGHAQAAHMLSSGNLVKDAQYFSGQVLVLCGSEDMITPEVGAKKIAAAYNNSSYQTLLGAGHASYIENPALCNDLILRFAENRND